MSSEKKIINKNTKTFLLINPCIYDFAAFDMWARPYGLYEIAGKLRSMGFNIALIDCMEEGLEKKHKIFGQSSYIKTKVPKDYRLYDILRNYGRYGITTENFIKRLSQEKSREIDLVLITSLMTYWYPGVFEAIRLVRKVLGDVPIILGGIYATICHEHAFKYSGADYVIKGSFENYLSRISPDYEKCDYYPAFDLQSYIRFIPLMTSKGCPFNCKYCASSMLNPFFHQKDPEDVIKEITYWHNNFNVRDFVFYDDALLINTDRHITVILEGILRSGLDLRLHTPNAVHIRFISKELAFLMKKTGFKTIRLGLESIEPEFHSSYDVKVKKEEFENAAAYLKEAGFSKDELGAYILWGLPGQDIKNVIKTAEFAASRGVAPYLTEFSPIPETALWDDALKHTRYPIDIDPLFQNNTLLPCVNPIDWNEIQKIKDYSRALRR